MKDVLRRLLYRICSCWVGVWPMRRVLVAGVHPVLQPNDPKRAKLSVGEALFTQVATFMSLPDQLLEQILQVLPTKDRLDLLESWLRIRGAGVKSLKIESWKIWSENSEDCEISFRTSGIIPQVFALCKVSLQSLTITDCGSVFAEADFAALAELSLIQKLHIQTDVQVRPQAISQLSCLTLLNSLSLTVGPGDRLNPLNHTFNGFPHAVVSLTALTSLTLSGWTFVGSLPESIGMLTALHELLLPNCVATRLPALLQKLTDLERLDFCSNALGRPDAADPPNCLLNAHKLTSIRLSGNYYSAVPTYLSSVTALQSLHIANNAAIGSGCTACLSHLTALTKLVMQQCNLTAVPQSLAALSRLKWLCLSRNMLESVPEGLPWQHLELLHLRGNQLTCVPCDALSTAVQLETVDCGENLPLQVDQYLVIWGLIKQLPRLQHLFIDKPTEDDGDDDLLSWSKASLQQIASLKKIMKKRKRRVCLLG